MEEKSLVVVEQPQNVQTESVLFIEQFINELTTTTVCDAMC